MEITGPDEDGAEQLRFLEAVYAGELEDDPDGVDSSTVANDKVSIPVGKASGARKRSKGGGFRGTRNDELATQLGRPDMQQKLVDYRDERSAHFSQAPDQAAIIAKFLKDNCDVATVTPNDLYTVYDLLGWPAPNPANALSNAKSRKGYFRKESSGYALTHTGEQFALHGSKAPASNDSD